MQPGSGKHVWAGGPGGAGWGGGGCGNRREGKDPALSAPLLSAPRDFCTEATLGWPLGSSPPAQVQSALGHAVKEGLKWA